MMKENKIDKLFKAKTSEGPFAFKEAHWAAAEKMLDAQPKGGGFRFGLMSGLVVVALSVASAWWWVDTNQNETGDLPIENMVQTETTDVENQNTSPDTKIQESDSYKKPVVSQPKQAQESGLTEKEQIKNTQPDHQEILNLERAESMPSQNDNVNKAQADAMIISQPEQAFKTTSSQSDDVTNSVEQASDGSQTDLARNDEAISPNTNLVETNSSNGTIPTASTSSVMLAATTEIKTQTRQPEKAEANTIGEEQTNPEQSETVSETILAGETETSGTESEEDIEPFKWTDNFTYSIGGEFGYYFNQRELTSSTKYQSFRNAHETQNGSFTGGLSVQLGYRNWTLNTGVYQYSIREDVQYPTALDVLKGVDNSHWNVNQNWSYKVDSTWVIDTIYVGHWQVDTNWSVNYDSTFVEQWDSTLVNEENPELAKNNGIKTISYAEVPVIFGRSFKMNKLVLDLQAGMSFGFLTKVEGAQYINQSVTNLATENQVDQFNRVVYSGILRVGLRFGLTQNLEAGIYPSLRYTFNSVLKPNYGEQRYLGYGLQFGLYYRL